MKNKHIIILCALLALAGTAKSQSTPLGPSTPSPVQDCGIYQWPPVASPCPEVQIKQKHDHTSIYRELGWDTAFSCDVHQIELSCTPYIPVQYFDGSYYVDEIPYDPADTTYHYGSQLPNNADDRFCAIQSLPSDFPFFFFGQRKTQFVAGGNGIISFNTASANQFCDYGNYIGLPWTPTSTGEVPNPVENHRDAIYGVFQDTDPSCNTTGVQGIWYGVKDVFPCRKIIASYNDLPFFSCSSNANNRQKYQIICYEGSNIIEVHISRRAPASCGWCQNAILGIQNSTGSPQTPGGLGSPTMYVINGSPAAFYPAGLNPITNQTITNRAFRFTPRGNTLKSYKWYRIFDDGSDSVELTADVSNPYGYSIPMDENSSCPTLTRAYVNQDTVVAKYVFELRFQNADERWYFLYDTITIGVDTANDLCLRPADGTCGQKSTDICAGQNVNLTLEYPSLQVIDTSTYSVYRYSNGQNIPLDIAQCLTFGNTNIVGDTLMRQQLTLQGNALPTQGLRANKIDSIYVQFSAEFVSGCTNYDQVLVRFYPNFDTTESPRICKGRNYTWSANGETYNTTTQATVRLTSTPGCDSTVHLDLKVLETSLTIDHVTDCQPYTWLNGQTYYTSNASTSALDTLRLTNEAGCDSIVQLDLTIAPVVAQIQSSREYFDFDHLDAVLTDISSSNDARTWMLPGGNTSSSVNLYYTIPVELDEADIWLVASATHNGHTCYDSTHIVLPLRKESFWVPNAFTPGNASGNNIFSTISTKTLTEEVYIYNRSGALVFKCEGVDCPWDGKDLNGNPCPQGTYAYFIRYTTEYLPKQVKVLKGTVTLIR